MQGIAAINGKKKMLLGAGLLVLAVAMILVGIYATFQADARQLERSTPVLNEKDVRIDEKVGNTLLESDAVTGAIEPDTATVDNSQQGETKPANSNVKVRVNGESIAVPENGTVHKEINTQNGSTSIDVTSQSNGSSGNSSTQSSINVDFDSSVQIRGESRE
jgi:hypothetical protein